MISLVGGVVHFTCEEATVELVAVIVVADVVGGVVVLE